MNVSRPRVNAGASCGGSRTRNAAGLDVQIAALRISASTVTPTATGPAAARISTIGRGPLGPAARTSGPGQTRLKGEELAGWAGSVIITVTTPQHARADPLPGAHSPPVGNQM